MKHICLWGVKQNNLKNLDVKIPLNSFTVICGPSGSGKSSLAFETLFAEGQRRYIESLSSYARQFLNKAPKPNLDSIENIPPSIAIEQKNSVKSSRSTVGTNTEVVEYLRLLFEKIGTPFCPIHKAKTVSYTPENGYQKIFTIFEKERGYILSPLLKNFRLLDGQKLHRQFLQDGYLRIYVPHLKHETDSQIQDQTSGLLTVPVGKILDLTSSEIKKSGLPQPDFYLVLDRLSFEETNRSRIVESLEQAFQMTSKYNQLNAGFAFVLTTNGGWLKLSQNLSCPVCSYAPPKLSNALFSFNNPIGACPHCNGFGNTLNLDEQKVIPNSNLSIEKEAIKPFEMPSSKSDKIALLNFCKKSKIPIDVPWKDLPLDIKNKIWNGTSTFYGIKGYFDYLEEKKYKMHVRILLARYRSPSPCPACNGLRLNQNSQFILIDGFNISQLCEMTIEDLYEKFQTIQLSKKDLEVSKDIFRQIKSRLSFLMAVGVDYLTLNRETRSLSGGEFQRIQLANQLGQELSQTLYVLDEPTIGLHPRDNARLIQTLKNLKDLGNTLVLVEHDHDVIANSDHVIEIGPGSGRYGGEIIFNGTKKDFLRSTQSNTAPFLKPQKRKIKNLSPHREIDLKNYKFKIELTGCVGHNLKNVDLCLPLNRLIGITGVSGSGKSSLITQTLYPAIAHELDVEHIKALPFKSLSGHVGLKNILLIDQTPIGKTARSSPVTYIKAFDGIRTLFSQTPEARLRKYTPGTFSLNVDGGRCPTCKGLGFEEIDMVFMDNLKLPCEACDGKRYLSEVLDVTYKNKNIADILNLTIQEAMDLFVNHPKIWRPLSLLKEMGLEYLCLGQSARSLSGGESQRLKIAHELYKSTHQNTLYILDEPTTGLHFKEIQVLLHVLNRLIETGGTVVVIEHNLDVIRHCDHLIDLGPDGGFRGGTVTFQGSPHEILNQKGNATGEHLKKYLDGDHNLC